MNTCPYCQQPLPSSYRQITTLENSTALALPQGQQNNFASAYRKTPYRKLDLVADVLVPLCWSTITGLILGIIAAVFSLFMDWPGYTGPVFGLISTGFVWVVSMFSDRGLWVIEEITGKDIDGDGQVGKPEKRIVQVEVRENGHTTKLADLPGDAHYLVRFCKYVAHGDSFSEATAQSCGYGVTNFRKLRDVFIGRRWAVWRNPGAPQQGVELTASGQAVVNGLADPSPDAPDEPKS